MPDGTVGADGCAGGICQGTCDGVCVGNCVATEVCDRTCVGDDPSSLCGGSAGNITCQTPLSTEACSQDLCATSCALEVNTEQTCTFSSVSSYPGSGGEPDAITPAERVALESNLGPLADVMLQTQGLQLTLAQLSNAVEAMEQDPELAGQAAVCLNEGKALHAQAILRLQTAFDGADAVVNSVTFTDVSIPGTGGSDGTGGVPPTGGTGGVAGRGGSGGVGGADGGRAGDAGSAGLGGTTSTDSGGSAGVGGTLGGTSGAGGTSGTSGTSGTDGTGGVAGSAGIGGTGGAGGIGGTAGTAGTAGSGGTGGSAGSGGSAGTSGTAGIGGSAGTAGSAGVGGTAGSAGIGGAGGSAGVSGSGGTAGSGGGPLGCGFGADPDSCEVCLIEICCSAAEACEGDPVCGPVSSPYSELQCIVDCQGGYAPLQTYCESLCTDGGAISSATAAMLSCGSECGNCQPPIG
jgi:hypothetical protein